MCGSGFEKNARLNTYIQRHGFQFALWSMSEHQKQISPSSSSSSSGPRPRRRFLTRGSSCSVLATRPRPRTRRAVMERQDDDRAMIRWIREDMIETSLTDALNDGSTGGGYPLSKN